jgi:prevent-host-death family protein
VSVGLVVIWECRSLADNVREHCWTKLAATVCDAPLNVDAKGSQDRLHDRTKLSKLSPVKAVKKMNKVNIHQAKTQLSRLVDEAANGKPFVIAKAGKPLVKVTALDSPTGRQVRRLGFLEGQFSVPDDFDTMGSSEIEQIFGSEE